MKKEFKNLFENEKLIDEHLKRLIGLNFIKTEEHEKLEKIEFGSAQVLLVERINKLKEWGYILGVKNIFSFDNQEIKATSLINSITNLNSLIKTSNFKSEAYVTFKENKKTKKLDKVINHDIFISSPNHENYIENELIKLLHGQGLFLREVNLFLECVNRLDLLEKIIIYYHYLSREKLPILSIKHHYANGVSQTSFYRIRDKAVIDLVDYLLNIH